LLNETERKKIKQLASKATYRTDPGMTLILVTAPNNTDTSTLGLIFLARSVSITQAISVVLLDKHPSARVFR
jgi:hypothetical protein